MLEFIYVAVYIYLCVSVECVGRIRAKYKFLIECAIDYITMSNADNQLNARDIHQQLGALSAHGAEGATSHQEISESSFIRPRLGVCH